MEVLIGGKSPIDLKALGLSDRKEAHRFLKAYGFDSFNKDDHKYMHEAIVESLYFIETVLMPKEWSSGQRPSKEIIECDNIADLLLWASSAEASIEARNRSAWACAVLRMAHTIAHIYGLQHHADFDLARSQIISRFSDAISRSKSGELMFGDDQSQIALERIEWKNQKSRQSIILKLLHKPANVAETIYDYVGVRIVTKSYADVLQVVKILGDQFIVSVPNANPARVRNNLIDLEKFKAQVDVLKDLLEMDLISSDEFLRRINAIDSEAIASKNSNPHSGAAYRSVQMTCRQLVRYPHPSRKWLEKCKKYIELNESKTAKPAANGLFSQVVKFASAWSDTVNISGDLKVFFPFEVQIFDSKTRDLIDTSDSNHILYKKSQIRTARKRVLGEVLKL